MKGKEQEQKHARGRREPGAGSSKICEDRRTLGESESSGRDPCLLCIVVYALLWQRIVDDAREGAMHPPPGPITDATICTSSRSVHVYLFHLDYYCHKAWLRYPFSILGTSCLH